MAEKSVNVDVLSVDELKEELRKMNLRISGSKAILRERLRAAIGEIEDGDREENDEGSGQEEDGDSEEDRQEEDSVDGAVARRRGASHRTTLTFKDVEDLLQTFSGYSKQNIRKGIEEFEDTCELCQWTKMQKIIYAKKLLRGSAKLFVSYEKCTNSWKKLKTSLIEEFAKTVSSKLIHKELASTKKQNDETYHQYMYRMMEIASHADIELEAKILYVIEIIPDDPFNKAVLYGAHNINELRKQLVQYETMKNT